MLTVFLLRVKTFRFSNYRPFAIPPRYKCPPIKRDVLYLLLNTLLLLLTKFSACYCIKYMSCKSYAKNYCYMRFKTCCIFAAPLVCVLETCFLLMLYEPHKSWSERKKAFYNFKKLSAIIILFIFIVHLFVTNM